MTHCSNGQNPLNIVLKKGDCTGRRERGIITNLSMISLTTRPRVQINLPARLTNYATMLQK